MIEVIMNFLLEIPTWILWLIALLLFIVLLVLISIFWDTKEVQPHKEVPPPMQHHKLYPGYIDNAELSGDVIDLVKKRIQKKNEKRNDANNEEPKPPDPPAPPDPKNPSKSRFKIIKGGKSGKN